MKKLLIAFAAVLFVGTVVLVFFPFLLIYAGILLEPDPPVPEVTYGEFPFRLEYSIDGREIVVSDTLICEYGGVAASTGAGKYVKWNGRFASGAQRIVLLKIDDASEIYYRVGSPRYYMGYQSSRIGFGHSFPGASIEIRAERYQVNSIVGAEELLSDYGIRLTRWDHSEPIVNSPGSEY